MMKNNYLNLDYDVVIIGASASGLMTAIEAGKRNKKVLILDHSNKVGKKILMSGGGRCNFTNYNIEHSKFSSNNSHFCKSALSRFSQWDFLAMVEDSNIAYDEKTLGQLFCDYKSSDIVNMLVENCEKFNVKISLNHDINFVKKDKDNFIISTISKNKEKIYSGKSLVIATGGLSIPTLGATSFGYKIAEQFNLNVFPTSAGLVPFTMNNDDKKKYFALSGVSLNAKISSESGMMFNESMLFTHRGLSGPVVLQISSYWKRNQSVIINILPNIDLLEFLKENKKINSEVLVKTLLSQFLPKSILLVFLPENMIDKCMKHLEISDMLNLSNIFNCWKFTPQGTEGYRTAEVTLGGVDTDEISSKTMEVKKVKSLYFIGEVLDVQAWLGGYNFQWAWSSGWACGQVC